MVWFEWALKATVELFARRLKATFASPLLYLVDYCTKKEIVYALQIR
jgi:hypothetical protein